MLFLSQIFTHFNLAWVEFLHMTHLHFLEDSTKQYSFKMNVVLENHPSAKAAFLHLLFVKFIDALYHIINHYLYNM